MASLSPLWTCLKQTISHEFMPGHRALHSTRPVAQTITTAGVV